MPRATTNDGARRIHNRRFKVQMPASLDARIRVAAAKRFISIADYIRDAVRHKIDFDARLEAVMPGAPARAPTLTQPVARPSR